LIIELVMYGQFAGGTILNKHLKMEFCNLRLDLTEVIYGQILRPHFLREVGFFTLALKWKLSVLKKIELDNPSLWRRYDNTKSRTC
jgi:hypothetical protein